MRTHDELKAIALADPETKTGYDALENEFILLDAMLQARKKAGLSQYEVAQRMNTKQSSIARIESSGGSKHHSPSLNTLRKYADAVGCSLDIKFIPVK